MYIKQTSFRYNFCSFGFKIGTTYINFLSLSLLLLAVRPFSCYLLGHGSWSCFTLNKKPDKTKSSSHIHVSQNTHYVKWITNLIHGIPTPPAIWAIIWGSQTPKQSQLNPSSWTTRILREAYIIVVHMQTVYESYIAKNRTVCSDYIA